jgi:hypothetical protein
MRISTEFEAELCGLIGTIHWIGLGKSFREYLVFAGIEALFHFSHLYSDPHPAAA